MRTNDGGGLSRNGDDLPRSAIDCNRTGHGFGYKGPWFLKGRSPMARFPTARRAGSQTEQRRRSANPAAFEDVARRHGRLLSALARRLTRDPSDASDLLQDAFERAMRSAPELGPDELQHWIVAVMRNLFVDRCRQRRVHSQALRALAITDASSSEMEEMPQWSTLTFEDVAAALAKLEPPFRQVFELRTLDMPLSQMAVELQIPPATAGTRLFRARQKLRAILTSSSLQSAAIGRNPM
jgi:RNA polymerase sigma-70 factor, ECF subfamily